MVSTKWLNKTYLFLCSVTIFGTTLFFSTATRSVFEVNKLGILKVSVSLMGILYFYDRLVGNQQGFLPVLANKGVNVALLLVWLSNVLSTIFSQHLVLSIFGSYDRWEGLLTTSFYLFLTFLIANKAGKKINSFIIWALIVACGLSSFYGIIQSYGLDIISWSLDPSMRVFGSINNPVHYCAIMGMSIPIVLGKLLQLTANNKGTPHQWRSCLAIIGYYILVGLINFVVNHYSYDTDSFLFMLDLLAKNSWLSIMIYLIIFGAPYAFFGIKYLNTRSQSALVNISFNSLALVIYACYLSYSRATWLGVTASLGLFFSTIICLSTHQKNTSFIQTVMGCLLLTMTMYLIFLFNLHTLSSTMFGILMLLLIGSTFLIIMPFWGQGVIPSIGIIGLMLLSQFFQLTPAALLFLILAFGICIWAKKKRAFLIPVQIMGFLLTFMTIQFLGLSVYHFLSGVLLVLILLTSEPTSSRQQWFGKTVVFKWKMATVGLVGLIFILPHIYAGLFSSDTDNPDLINQANIKIESYSRVAIDGTARTSMWKSALPWIMDYPILGTGLDTIKYYFPKYRRSEYGALEGGHNYTPDRLHNEYLNTLATKGLVGFVAYYLILIGGSIISLLLYIRTSYGSQRYILLGCISGMLVYLGQVLFNFGVVATLVYFFIFLGVGLSIKHNHAGD